MRPNHPNHQEVNKILYVLAALQNEQVWQRDPNATLPQSDKPENAFKKALKDAMTNKINVYRQRLNSPTITDQLRAAFRKKIEDTRAKIDNNAELDDSIVHPD